MRLLRLIQLTLLVPLLWPLCGYSEPETEPQPEPEISLTSSVSLHAPQAQNGGEETGKGLRYSGTFTDLPWGLRQVLDETVEPGKRQPYLVFKKSGELNGFGGCNAMRGKYQLEGSNYLLVTHLRATRKACTQETPQERKFSSLLILANAYQLQGNKLSLFQSEFPESILMTFEAVPGLDTRDTVEDQEELSSSKAKPAKTNASSKKTTKSTAKKSVKTTKPPVRKTTAKKR